MSCPWDWYFFWCRALLTEFDDLSSKSREADKEVNMLQMKIQEVTDNLSKHRKDVDCKYHPRA